MLPVLVNWPTFVQLLKLVSWYRLPSYGSSLESRKETKLKRRKTNWILSRLEDKFSPPTSYNFSLLLNIHVHVHVDQNVQFVHQNAFNLKFLHRTEFVFRDAVCGVCYKYEIWDRELISISGFWIQHTLSSRPGVKLISLLSHFALKKDKWRGSSCLQPNVACGPHSRSRADWIRLWLISCSPQLSYIMSKAVILLVSGCTAYNICPGVIAPSRSHRRAIVIDASSYFLRINNKHQSMRP